MPLLSLRLLARMDPGPALAWRSPLFLIAASLSTVLWMVLTLTWMPWIKFLSGRTCILLWILYGNMVDFSFIVSLYVSDLPNVTISTRTMVVFERVRAPTRDGDITTKFISLRSDASTVLARSKLVPSLQILYLRPRARVLFIL